ncbi:hypothetical protein HPB48_022054 [Haemaphysalis longicornis]|uniref:Uncharacterized protein n=1 Tax=Haemaphysalis longicornis TaxID=44386 RepID=A0A9J6G6H6_HAELO|nr:hypothetical protein HPB48_022054 [Haemaphysalis longicornis]
MSSSLSSRKKKNYSVRALVPENEEDGPCDAMAQRRSPEPLMDPTAMDAVTDGGVATPQPLLGVPQAVPADSPGGEPAGYILEQPGIRTPCPGATPSEPSRIHGRSPPADQQGVPAVTATGPETASLVGLEPALQTGKPVSTAAGVPVAESQVPVSMAVVPKPQVSIANAPYTTAKSNEGIPVTPAAGIAPETAEARVPSRDSAPAVETLSAPPIRKPSLTVPISTPRSATQKSKTSVQEKGPSARLIPDQQATPDMVNTSSAPPLSTSSLDRHPSTCAAMQGGPKLVPSTPNTLSEQVVPPILLGTRRRSSTCKVLSFAQAATEPPTPIPTVSPPLTPGVSSVAPLPPSPMVINAPDNGPEIPSASSAGALQPEKKAEDSVAGVRSPQTKEGLHGPVVSPVPDYGYSAGRGFPGYREDPSNWRFPGAGARPGVSPSAVAPTPAAPSAAVFGSSKMATARQVAAFPGAYIRQQSSWNMPLSPEALDTHTAAGELQPADDTTPETETAQRQPDSLFSTSYTRLTWSTVTIPSAPFTFASSSIIGSVDAKTEPHHQVAEDSFQNGQAPIALAALTEASKRSAVTTTVDKPQATTKGMAPRVAATAVIAPTVGKKPSTTTMITAEAAKPPVPTNAVASVVAGKAVTGPTMGKRPSTTTLATAKAAKPQATTKEVVSTVVGKAVSGPTIGRPISRTVVSKRPSAADLRSTTLHMRPGDTPDAAAASGSEESKLRLATSHAVETFKEQREELDDGKAQVGVQPLLAWCKKRPKGKISLVVQAPPSAQGSNLSLKLKPGTAKGERRLSNISQASKFKMNTDRLKTSTSKHATSNITAVKGTSVGRAHRRESSLTGENRKISARTSDIQYEKSELFNSNTKQTSASLIKRRFSKLPSITSANQASAAAPRIASSFSASSSEKPNLQNSQIDVGGGKDSTSFKTAELPKYQLVLARARKLCRNKILLEVESPLTKKPTSHSKEIIDKRQQEVFSTAPTRHEVSERMSLGRKPSDSSTLNSQARKNSITRTRDVSARSAKALAATAVKKNARKTTSATSAENKKSEPHKQKRSFQETKSSNRAAAYPVFLTQDKYSALHMAGGGGESPVGIVAMGPFRRSLGLAQLNDTESEGDATSQLVFTVSPSSPPAVSVREGLGTPTEIFQLAPCTESDQPPDCDPPSLASSVFEKRKKAKKHKVKDVGNNAPPEGSEGEPLQLPRVTSRYVQANLETSGEGHAEAALRDEDTPSVLIASTLFLVAVVLALLIALTYLQATVTPPSETQPIPSPPAASAIVYCSSEFCDREAEYIKSLLGARGTDACENFYEYVCTAWSQSHPAGGSIGTGAAVSTDTIIQDRLVHMLASFLPSNRAEDISVAVPLFNACTDRKKAYAATRDIKELLKRWRIGQWPREAPGTIKDVWVFAGELVRDLGLVSLIELEVVASLENPDHTFIELRKPSLLFAGNDVYRSSVKTLFQLALRDAASEFTQASKAEILGEVMQVFIRFSSAPLELGSTEIDVDKFPGLVAATVNQSELDVDIKDFLYVSFDNATILNPERVIMIKPVKYVRDFLATAMREVAPRALLNYIGFLVIVHFSPFLPEQQVNLRQLFAKSFLGRTLPHVTNSSALCMIAVERAVPTCFSKLSMNIFKDLEYDLHVPEKLSQLEKAFARNIRHLAWMNDELALLKRYRIKRGRASQFGPAAAAGYNSSCPHSQRPPTMGSPVHYYHSVSRQQQRSRLQRALSGRAAATESGSNFRPSSVRASYDRLLHRVLVPAALFNTSVPVNSVGFSLQLARYAVRFYHALLDSMFLVDLDPGYWGGDAPRRRLEGLLECFEEDLRLLPARLRGQVAPDSALSRAAVLQQTVALQLAFRAFQELWQVRRSWKQDFRYQRLPQLSSDALFFVYYALDNCESSDVVYKEHAGHWLPADYRVNLPLRHLVEFASLFNCSAETSMGRMISGHTCNVVSPGTWSGLAPRNT